MGKKYIIELEDEVTLWGFLTDTDGEIAVTGVIKQPYTEPDLEQVRKEAYEKGFDAGRMLNKGKYEKGLYDMWEVAKKIFGPSSKGALTIDEMKAVFGSIENIYNCTATEAIEKLKAYEDSKQEIKVGDEVDAPFGKAVVLDVTDNAVFYLYAAGGTGWEEPEYVRKHKTGRNFAEITTALEKLRGKQKQ